MWEVRNAIMWEGGGGSIFERAEWNLNLWRRVRSGCGCSFRDVFHVYRFGFP